jgi:hypothetical protein
MSYLKLLAIVLLVAGASACADDPTIPSDTTPPSTTEVFSGTLTTNGAATHPFSTAIAGTVVVTLSKVLVGEEANTSIKIGVLLGIWNGTVCQSSASNDSATQGVVIARDVTGAGRLCVRVYDAAGTLTDPITYEVTVIHP